MECGCRFHDTPEDIAYSDQDPLSARSALMLICGVLACTAQNPAYEASSAGGSGSGASTAGTDAGPGGDPSGAASDSDGVTSEATGETDPGDATTDGSATETGGPSGCPGGLMPGEMCHALDDLAIPGNCVPRPVEIADLDDDGYGEILIGCEGGSLLRFDGSAEGPAARPSVVGHAGAFPRDIDVGQLDAGPDLDILVVNESQFDGVRVFVDGSGDYLLEDYDVGEYPTRGAIGNWNGAGGPDIAVTLTASDQVAFLTNNGTMGTFSSAEPSIDTPDEPLDLALGDLNDDGLDDLAVVSRSGNTLSVFLNQLGAMPPIEQIYGQEIGAQPNRVLINNIEPDDTVDILLTQGGMSGLRIYRGMGEGAYDPEPPEIVGLGQQLQGLDDGDFDGNELPDAVLVDRDGQMIYFLMLITPPDIVMTESLTVDGVPWDIAAGDINGDGVSDVVVSQENDRVTLVLSGA